MKQKKSLGWVPDLPDHRDHIYAAPLHVVTKLPSKIDLTSKCPPVYNQGQIGSCTANAIGAAFEFNMKKQKLKKIFTPSRLFIYYNERAMERTINSDSGAQIRDGIKTVNKLGACPEEMWKYNDGPKQFTIKPNAKCYSEALKHQVVSYQRVTQTLNQLKGCIASGYPFVFGFTVFESFMSDAVAKSGIMPIPKTTEACEGGHAVICVGYDDVKQCFIIRNSWGATWGKKGYFFMPYAYITDNNNADDFWTIRLVEE